MRERTRPSHAGALPTVPAEAALSFLKDTKGALTWPAKELAETLKIGRREAEQVLQFLEAQGYVQRARGTGEWMTTPAGESVAGATPRFARESVEQAVAALKERIAEANKNAKAPFKIAKAVAFGDFLRRDRARAQAADVGIGLTRRGQAAGEVRSASEAAAEREFLRELRGRTALLHLRPYADWMSTRSHVKLV
jgi:DNA-binding MarR family transcriptional regulator